jgi:hypothetical protein
MATADHASDRTGCGPVAEVCRGQDRGWRSSGSVQVALDQPRAALWTPARNRNLSRGLPYLLSGAQGRLQRQHDQDGPRVIAGLSSPPLRLERTEYLDAASVSTSRPMADERGSPQAGRYGRYAAYQTVRDLGAGNWRSSGCYPGPHMGSRGLRARIDRLQAVRAHTDEQAPRGAADEPNGSRGARDSLCGAFDRPCDRVQRQAGIVGQEGCAAAIRSSGNPVFATHPSAYVRSLDGAGRCAHAENQSVSRTHLEPRDRAGLREVLALVYAGCERRFDVLNVRWYFGSREVHRQKWLKTWWAVTVSNRRPSRCKRDALPTELTARSPGTPGFSGFSRWVN